MGAAARGMTSDADGRAAMAGGAYVNRRRVDAYASSTTFSTGDGKIRRELRGDSGPEEGISRVIGSRI